MKYVVPALAVALIIGPVAASAQVSPQPAPPGANASRWGGNPAMAAMFRQEVELHRKFRSQALAALSSSHRVAIGNIIGALAVSTTPDARGAAARIDALLSQSERQTILSARDSFEQSSRSLHDQMRSAMSQQMDTTLPSPPPRPARVPSNDAGRVLLMALSPGGPEFAMMHGRGMGGPGMSPPAGSPPNGAPPNGPPPDGAPPQP